VSAKTGQLHTASASAFTFSNGKCFGAEILVSGMFIRLIKPTMSAIRGDVLMQKSIDDEHFYRINKSKMHPRI
jgi:hypothetical protein